MHFALISDLEQSSFIPGESGIGTQQECVKLFETHEAARNYAETLLTLHTDNIDIRESPNALETFQEMLGSLEWFHIFPVVK